MAGWAVGGFGIGLAYSPVSLIVLGEAPSGQEGAASSSLQLAETLGVAPGPASAGCWSRRRPPAGRPGPASPAPSP